MTRDAILKCLTDRPCDVCVFHADGHCQTWNCVFEEKPDDAEDCEDKGMTREEAIAKLKNFADHCYPNEEFLMAIKSLSAEPCEDAISRQAVDDAIYDYSRACDVNYGQIMEYIDKIPSVTSKPKMGHWILDHVVCDVIYEYHCSACGHRLELGGHTIKQEQAEGHSLFCDGCGAKMEAEGEE